ncbi:MAG: tetratricopeptide repeat protein [Gammaproteobacteria bacterium]
MKKKTPVKAEADKSDVTHLAAMAKAKLDAGQYKEAIEQYKQLLKQADNKEWRSALAQCYLKRALSFAEKGMVKEAVVLWENYQQNAEPPYQNYDSYIAWLLKIDNANKVKTCFSGLSAQQLDEHYPNLAALLGLLIVTEKPGLEAMLPTDSQFINHLASVRAALSAYRNNEMDAVEQALKQLPFRSAFRDFRTLVKAALLLPESVEQVQALLIKIPATSPYYQAAKLLLVTTQGGLALVDELLQCEQKQRQLIGILKKFSKKQLELLDVLVKQKDRLSDKLKFNCAFQFRDLFGQDHAQAYCRAALATYPAGQRDFNKHFGALDEFEQWRLKALHFEREKDFDRSEYYWQQGISLLKKRGDSEAFKIALIMRHIAVYQPSTEEGVGWLEQSLDYDPGCGKTYLEILQYYEHEPEDADLYKQWLDKGLKAFPKDVDLLALAIKAATANKAFKKASQYAKNLLKIDPVNTFAKQVLYSSHLAHTRKLIKTKKFHLVEKEIQQAETLKLGKRYQNQAQLVRGFFVMLAEDRKQGLQQIAEAVQKMNDGSACGYFSVIVEALLMGVSLPFIQKALPRPPKNYQLSEQEIGHLVQIVQQYYGEDKNNTAVLHQALEKIKTIVKQSIKQKIVSEQTLLTLSECLDNIRHFELLAHCAKIALMQWTKPIWIFYKVYAQTNGSADQCSSFNIEILQFNFLKARKDSDHRTAMRISRFIDEYYEDRNSYGIFDNEFDEDDEDEDFDPFTADSPISLFEHLPQDVVARIQNELRVIMEKNSPERMFKIINKSLSEPIAPTFILLNPDAFVALLMLRVAAQLGIETGVTGDQVVEFCEKKQGSKPSSFPPF